MRFGSPAWLWLLVCIPAFIGLFIYAYQRNRRILHCFAAQPMMQRLAPQELLPLRIVKWTLFLLFFICAVIALARPQFGVKMQLVERRGTDIMVAMDVSQSMLAEDVAPNRLERAKYEVGRFADMLKGDRLGLIIFAGESFVQCPLTTDYGAINMFLQSISTDWIESQGTAIGAAINQARESFKGKPGKSHVLIIISDGEDHDGDAVEAAKMAAAENIKIYTIGVGSASGVPIPIGQNSGSMVYKKDKDGNLVMTKMDPAMLQEIADAGNGAFFDAGTSLDLIRIYGDIDKLEKNKLGTDELNLYEEQYQLFVILALFFILLEFVIPDRGRMPDSTKGQTV
jgi:Ca-activated chloride channel homolog